MERKTTGSFIAVLRKANGLTQKDFLLPPKWQDWD